MTLPEQRRKVLKNGTQTRAGLTVKVVACASCFFSRKAQNFIPRYSLKRDTATEESQCAISACRKYRRYQLN